MAWNIAGGIISYILPWRLAMPPSDVKQVAPMDLIDGIGIFYSW